MASQVGPYLDRSMLDAGIFGPAVHAAWMCYCARLPLNAQRLDKTLSLMFLAKLHDYTQSEACSSAAGGWFSGASYSQLRTWG